MKLYLFRLLQRESNTLQNTKGGKKLLTEISDKYSSSALLN